MDERIEFMLEDLSEFMSDMYIIAIPFTIMWILYTILYFIDVKEKGSNKEN